MLQIEFEFNLPCGYIDEQGMRSLLGDGKIAIMAGRSTPEEVLRVCQREEF